MNPIKNQSPPALIRDLELYRNKVLEKKYHIPYDKDYDYSKDSDKDSPSIKFIIEIEGIVNYLRSLSGSPITVKNKVDRIQNESAEDLELSELYNRVRDGFYNGYPGYLEQYIKKIDDDKKELKTIIKEKENNIGELNSKVKTTQEHNDELVKEKKILSGKNYNLERENENYRSNVMETQQLRKKNYELEEQKKALIAKNNELEDINKKISEKNELLGYCKDASDKYNDTIPKIRKIVESLLDRLSDYISESNKDQPSIDNIAYTVDTFIEDLDYNGIHIIIPKVGDVVPEGSQIMGEEETNDVNLKGKVKELIRPGCYTDVTNIKYPPIIIRYSKK